MRPQPNFLSLYGQRLHSAPVADDVAKRVCRWYGHVDSRAYGCTVLEATWVAPTVQLVRIIYAYWRPVECTWQRPALATALADIAYDWRDGSCILWAN